MSTEKKYYAYLLPDGTSGTTSDWKKCEGLVKNKRGSRYKGFKTKEEADKWLRAGARYEIKVKKKMSDGIFFDAGTGRGEGVEISVTDKDGKDVLSEVMHAGLINKHGKHLLPKGKTNNYGELFACLYALKIAEIKKEKEVFGDSRLVVDYWSKGFIKKEVGEETVKLAKEVSLARKIFEDKGGSVSLISGDDNPADLGFHR
ncbi:MAG: viroplasmin family protein [Candidatus Colwellbacteria bacterium]|nr:viroplasmin family protein [Candidatus Colwellbacteria bacterium]